MPCNTSSQRCGHPVCLADKQIRAGMSLDAKSTPSDIMNWWKDHQNHSLPYMTAYRALHNIIGDSQVKQAEQFALLPSYINTIHQRDPFSLVKLKRAGNRFSSLFIAPASARAAWPHLRPLICVDAAFTKTIHNYVLIIATGIDANQEGLNLAWGIAPKENEDHWRWFLSCLNDALDNLNQPQTVIMSDRQKGLNKAVQMELDQVTQAFCCKHIYRNLTEEYGKEIQRVFWPIVKARTEAKFKDCLAEMRALNER